jgi:DNA-binding transcriptional MerR regulator
VNGLMPIGEFSTLCQLSVKMLRHYDEIGLLVPAHVDPITGYRFYAAEQTRLAMSIRELRALDMPLGEIREVVAADNPERVRDLLWRHRARLARQLEDAERRIALVERLIGEEIDMVDEIREVHLPAIRVATRRAEGATGMFLPIITAAFADLFMTLGEESVKPVGPPIQIVRHGDEERFEHDACFPIGPEAEVSVAVETHVLAATDAATLRHAGPLDEGNLIVHSIFGWLSAKGKAPVMPFRVSLLALPPLFSMPELAESPEPVYEVSVPF